MQTYIILSCRPRQQKTFLSYSEYQNIPQFAFQLFECFGLSYDYCFSFHKPIKNKLVIDQSKGRSFICETFYQTSDDVKSFCFLRCWLRYIFLRLRKTKSIVLGKWRLFSLVVFQVGFLTFLELIIKSSKTGLFQSQSIIAYCNSYQTRQYSFFWDAYLELFGFFYLTALCFRMQSEKYSSRGQLNLPICLKRYLSYRSLSQGKSQCRYFGIDFRVGLNTVFQFQPSQQRGSASLFMMSVFYIAQAQYNYKANHYFSSSIKHDPFFELKQSKSFVFSVGLKSIHYFLAFFKSQNQNQQSISQAIQSICMIITSAEISEIRIIKISANRKLNGCIWQPYQAYWPQFFQKKPQQLSIFSSYNMYLSLGSSPGAAFSAACFPSFAAYTFAQKWQNTPDKRSFLLLTAGFTAASTVCLELALQGVWMRVIVFVELSTLSREIVYAVCVCMQLLDFILCVALVTCQSIIKLNFLTIPWLLCLNSYIEVYNIRMAEAIEKDIRTQMLQALAKYNIKQVDVARQAGIHHSTLSLWLQGKVKGHHIKIEDTLAEWLDSLYSGRPRYTTLNKTVDKQFILTPPVTNIPKKRAGDLEQVLIPIHFDLELEGKRYKQQFCWNINDPYFTPQEFAHLIVTENQSLVHFEGQIRETIRKAISSYRNPKSQQASCIRTLELDVKIDSICLKDRFDWDINDESAIPEDFAYHLAQQLNLNNEFMVKIAHQIRQQLQYYRKNNNSITTVRIEDAALLDIKKSTRNLISLSDNPNGQNEREIAITPANYLRRNVEEWQPKIQILDAGEVRKFQKQEERQNRYARRAR